MYWICGTSTVFLNLLDGRHLSLHDHRHIHNSVDVLNLRNLDLLGHLVDLLLDDGFLSLHGLLDDSGLLHFDRVHDMLNVRVHDLLCDFRDLDDLLL